MIKKNFYCFNDSIKFKFLFIGIIMTLVQGGYVRRIKEGKHIKAAISAIFLLIPGFVIIALAMDQIVFYVGLALYCFSSAVVVQCFTTIISNYGYNKFCFIKFKKF